MRKIAIVRRNGLGDLLCTFPLILYFRKYFPKDHLTLFVDKRNACLLPFLPPVDHVAIFPDKGNKYWNIIRTAWHYRASHFDLAISAKTSPMKLLNVFLFTLGAKIRTAYVKDSWHRWLINAPIEFNEVSAKNTHQALKCLHLVDQNFHAVPEELYPKAKVPEGLVKTYSPILSSLPIGRPVLLLSATTTRLSSRLNPARYAEIVNRLYKKHSFSVVIIGQEVDKERAMAISKMLIVPHLIHFPRNFETFMVLLHLSDLYFVGDGGIAHLGAALDKHAVVVYGETNPIEWQPLSKQVSCFYHPTHVDYLSDEEIFYRLEKKFEDYLLCKKVPKK